MSSMTFAPLGRRLIATAREVIVEDVRGRRRELRQFEAVRATPNGIIVGRATEGKLRWIMRSWRGRINRNGFAAMQEFSKNKEQ